MVGALAGRTVRLLEAFAGELETERNRLIGIVALTCAAICSCTLAIGLTALFAAVVLPVKAGAMLLAALAAVFTALSVIFGLWVRRRLLKDPVRLPFLSGVLAAGQVLRAALDREDSA